MKMAAETKTKFNNFCDKRYSTEKLSVYEHGALYVYAQAELH